MVVSIHSLDRAHGHSGSHAAQITGGSAPTANATQAQAQTTQAPSFTALFAQIAAAAAAADSKVAVSTSTPGPLPTAAPAAEPSDGPAGPLFGSNPWLADPTGKGPDGSVTHYNPVYFATQQTAQTVAQMLGGKVVQANEIITAPGSPFTQDQSNYMVQLPDGAMVNPGFIADIYTHGWSQSFVDQQVANEVKGAEAAVSA